MHAGETMHCTPCYNGLLSIGPEQTNFSEILTQIQNFSSTKIHLKISSANWLPSCSGGDELRQQRSPLESAQINGIVEEKYFHEDVIKWKHFPRYHSFVRGIHRSPENSPHKGQWRGALMFSLICAWINCRVNSREAGDLRRHRAHYGVIVMYKIVYVAWYPYILAFLCNSIALSCVRLPHFPNTMGSD